MKKVVGFENWYSVTDDGHIFSHHRDVWLKPSKVGAGSIEAKLKEKNNV